MLLILLDTPGLAPRVYNCVRNNSGLIRGRTGGNSILSTQFKLLDNSKSKCKTLRTKYRKRIDNMNRPTTVGLRYMTPAERRQYDTEKAKRHYRKVNPSPSQIDTGFMQVCRVCRVAKPFTTQYFHLSTGRARSKRKCRDCVKATQVRSNARSKYKLTDEQYQMLRARPCVLCGSKGQTVFDHCHKTNKFRNMLCYPCNVGLGLFKDNPTLLRLAAQYVEHYAAAHGSIPVTGTTAP